MKRADRERLQSVANLASLYRALIPARAWRRAEASGFPIHNGLNDQSEEEKTNVEDSGTRSPQPRKPEEG